MTNYDNRKQTAECANTYKHITCKQWINMQYLFGRWSLPVRRELVLAVAQDHGEILLLCSGIFPPSSACPDGRVKLSRLWVCSAAGWAFFLRPTTSWTARDSQTIWWRDPVAVEARGAASCTSWRCPVLLLQQTIDEKSSKHIKNATVTYAQPMPNT